MPRTKIMIVEGEAVIAADLKKEAEQSGYLVSGVFIDGEDAVKSRIIVQVFFWLY